MTAKLMPIESHVKKLRADGERYLKQVLAAMPATHAQIVASTGLSSSAVSRWLKYAREHDLAYIKSYEKAKGTGRGPELYAAGKPPKNYKAPQRPPAQSNVVAVQKYRARKRKEGSWEDNLAQQRARHWQTRPVKRDPLTAAFFGGVPPLSQFPSTSADGANSEESEST